ncbi:hypothetical protein DFQ10_102148 [Winogradskyella eximia]|uniref:Uncharacterized protein n=1 Tax=Winogradskyella eximia TaxID=262006 RepID=A0A3D9H706_9FLAO|nr:hypothetical protein [Winogradskyella eximia]RED45280.1 hypothetical protein DFQ10_102148 [Winogradskyella eximia]
MKYRHFESRKFRLCVIEARKCITAKDDFSLEARNLLAQLIYDNESIKKINFLKIDWETILLNHTEWIEYYDITENRFNEIIEYLINKTSSYKSNT